VTLPLPGAPTSAISAAPRAGDTAAMTLLGRTVVPRLAVLP
jgi:hypothetical protein